MLDVKKGDYLDFSKAKVQRIDPPMETIKIPMNDIKQIKAHIKNLGDKLKTAKDNLAKDNRETEKWKDDLYIQALNSFEEASIPTGIKGTAKIRL